MSEDKAENLKFTQKSSYEYGWSCGFATAAATVLIVLILYGVYVRFFPNGIPIVF